MTKPDWAEQLIKKHLYIGCVGDEDAIERNAAKLLRAERRRAVRVCKLLAFFVASSTQYSREDRSYMTGCNDCAEAIQKEKK